MSRFICVWMIGLGLLSLPDLIQASVQTAAGEAAVFRMQEGGSPYEDPKNVQERIETGSPEETLLHQGNKRWFGIGAVTVAALLLGTLIWAFRSGRKNKPVSGGPKRPPSV